MTRWDDHSHGPASRTGVLAGRLDQFQDFLGRPLAPDIVRRLRAVLRAPSVKTWDDTHGIILRSRPGLGLTLWQAVRAVDPSFPNTGRVYDRSERLHQEWVRIPDTVLLARAIAYARSLPR
jgi:hypothetical protein